ncbi:cobalt-precorrin-7 (C(5))-methyltransferase [Methanohalophilus portucalensis]|uniref:Cobalt-precorrin-7 (C(5))-methyltransferase n=2 Tax=Methanohalophilus portucalensis TaxID=39664 RepID=A0A1L9C1Y1_9EURY|nr:cobalt-precorrin-7 (C(5))-methyltransferase [Methanohalophilus portucalensis]ATU09125.1 precorrin-6y C5,15-methyltransferase (decarboxylating) subunit CbiE [Methanohalophilus portucalensis]OJH48428.1 precorrin-6Y C5,15-methyltransferase [Methanohalophilus portucalensis FDF-1]RNI08558.1 cobalt-precorrin-7 (C(5))-methyltransferase [Methanohalophilus portucalensis FDF-1]SMH44859.1 precorrin-6Y C5,15-methyltransferase (decarboxylating) [Methanohalophilus portucalensis FDF-1]
MIVVGVGVGPGMLTEQAIETIENAGEVYGSPRSLELAGPYIKGESMKIKDYKNLHLLGEDAVVLSTGDPMFSGLGKFAGEGDSIIPGISSMHVACARTKTTMNGLAVITAHGRDPRPAREAFVTEIKLGKNVLLLPAETFGSVEVAEILEEMEVQARIYVCEKLGYPEESIIEGTVDNPPLAQSALHCLLVVR